VYECSSHCKMLLVQLWGAGGGSGNLLGQQGGCGGAGAFMEFLLHCRPGKYILIFFAAKKT
jgi:hypothetical protein